MVGNYDQQLRTTVIDISSLGKPGDRNFKLKAHLVLQRLNV